MPTAKYVVVREGGGNGPVFELFGVQEGSSFLGRGHSDETFAFSLLEKAVLEHLANESESSYTKSFHFMSGLTKRCELYLFEPLPADRIFFRYSSLPGCVHS